MQRQTPTLINRFYGPHRPALGRGARENLGKGKEKQRKKAGNQMEGQPWFMAGVILLYISVQNGVAFLGWGDTFARPVYSYSGVIHGQP